MGDEWKEGSDPDPDTQSARPSQDDLDKRIEEIRRKVIDTTSEAQQRIKRVVDKAGTYWQQTKTPLHPRHPTRVEEDRIPHLTNSQNLDNSQPPPNPATYLSP